MLAKATSLFLLGLVRLLTGARARWHGGPPKAEQRIDFANDQRHTDLVLIWAALPQELRAITRPIATCDDGTKSRLRQWITTAMQRFFERMPLDRVHALCFAAPIFFHPVRCPYRVRPCPPSSPSP